MARKSYSRKRGGKLRALRRRAMIRSMRRAKAYSRNILSKASGFPKKLLVKHKYVETVTNTNVAGIPGSYLFNCNGMYKPNYSTAGHQPLYFDQMYAIYNHYTVIGSRIKVTATPSAVYAVGANLAIYINDDTTYSGLSNINNAQEQHSGKFRFSAAGANQPVVMYSKWSAKKTFGGSVLGNDLLQGTYNANPTEASYYQIMVYPLDGGVQTWYLNVEIEYLAVWDELKDIASS